jgi:PGF-CTERM protein
MSFGEAGIYTMLWYPSFKASVSGGGPQDVVIPFRNHYNFAESGRPGTLNESDPRNYAHPVTDGWDGDRLVPYVTDSSVTTNETGYVWRIRWDSQTDANEFSEAYVALLDHYDAEPVTGNESTYKIPGTDGFGDAFYINNTGQSVTIVNAPTVGDLSMVRAGAAPATEQSTDPTPSEDEGSSAEDANSTETQTDNQTQTNTDTDPSTEDTETPASDDDGPGFGVAVALCSLLLVAAVVRARVE